MQGILPLLSMLLLSLASLWLSAGESSELLVPYRGPSVQGVDTSTLKGKVMTGYQGWFNCEGDGAKLGWKHWAVHRNRPFAPGNVNVDLWPDVSEFDADELFPTGFQFSDNQPALVFSSYRRETVLRHFRWMREYGIDGAFVQRFANGLNDRVELHHKDVVLSNCREGANLEGRAYAVMYDLSGLQAGGVARVVDDWRKLRDRMKIGYDAAYLRHEGKPVVAVWGIGFGDDRRYTLAECRALIEFLKADGCTVMVGIPTAWRDLNHDASPDPGLHEVLKLADVLSPWTPGRYRNPKGVVQHAKKYWEPDIAWCRERSLDYLPVVFPGFSWHNMNPGSPLNDIPRLKGEFLWRQFAAAKAAGAEMIYVAMFDEVDEGTAIFKCSSTVLNGPNPFVDMEGLPSDHYLWLAGQGAALLRGELPLLDAPPTRAP
jgi:hypothetical protein